LRLHPAFGRLWPLLNGKILDVAQLVSIRKRSFSVLGGRAAASLAAAFGGGTNMISTLREAVPKYASAQPLDFLASTKNASFSNWKLLVFHPEFPDGH